MSNTPTLRYFLSETYGPVVSDPTLAQSDPDVIVETELSELEDALQHDEQGMQRLSAGTAHKINIRGREIALSRHIIGILQEWHRAYGEALAAKNAYNGAFVNYAPRDLRFRNGPPFYIAEMENNLRIVTTFPGDVLATVREDVKRITEIPNEHNPVFGDTAQFRSRDAHRWLRRNANDTYPEISLSDEKQHDVLHEEFFHADVEGLRLEFVDIYGNMIFENNAEVQAAVTQAAGNNENLKVSMNDVTVEDVEPTRSLTEGKDGSYLIYPNGNHIDLVRKWTALDTPEDTVEKSIFRNLRHPESGKLPRELYSGLKISFPDGKKSKNVEMAGHLS